MNAPNHKFLRQLASKEPIPGGGSAAALAGALGVALGVMVCRLLTTRVSLRGKRFLLIGRLKKLEKVLKRLTDLVEEDARAYAALLQAQKSHRNLSKARRGALRTPRQICEAVREASATMEKLVPLAGPYLGADLKAGQALLQGADRAASWMVQVNEIASPARRGRSPPAPALARVGPGGRAPRKGSQ